jgi:hypothetical protein
MSITGGDFNHDGISDLLIGAHGYSSYTGRSYIVWGHNGTWPTTINAADIGGTVSGVKIIGVAGSCSGASVANAGDVNHDGKTDLIIGAVGASPSGLTYAGRAYIVFGKGSGTWPTTINLGNLTAADGVIINSAAAWDFFGYSVSGNVDVNGDNTADVIVSAHWANPDATRNDAGITYVVFGSATLPSTIDTSGSTFFDGTKGFKLFGEKADDNSGWSVSGGGDVNGDGIGDIIIGADWDQSTTITDAGRSYVVLGHRGAWPAVVELSSLDGKNGFTISGNLQDEYSGYSVSGAGDINNDGFSDIIVGAHGWNSSTGRTVVVYGSFFMINCKTADTITGKCQECDSGHGLSNDIPGMCDDCNLIPGTWSNGIIPCSCQFFFFIRHTRSPIITDNYHHTFTQHASKATARHAARQVCAAAVMWGSGRLVWTCSVLGVLLAHSGTHHPGRAVSTAHWATGVMHVT